MPLRRRDLGGKLPVHWWSDDIAVLRMKILSCRRRYQHSLRRQRIQGSGDARTCFIIARKELRLAIRRAKDRCWKVLCEMAEFDPWGKPYRIVKKKFGGNTFRLASIGEEPLIADHLFLAIPVTGWDLAPPAFTAGLFDAFDPDTDTLSYEMVIPLFAPSEL